MRTCTHNSTSGPVPAGTIEGWRKQKQIQVPNWWAQEARTTSGGLGTISREQVVDAATWAVEEGRYEQLTIRSLAADLGVGPISLYRHVRDKDDLLVEVTDRLLAETWKPWARRGNWQAWIAEAAGTTARALGESARRPPRLPALPVVTPAAIDRMEAMLAVLRHAGFDEP